MTSTVEPTISEWASALEQVQRFLWFLEGYVSLVFLSMGVLGNSVSFVIFLRTRQRADAAVQYLSCLAVSDTGCILVYGFVHWLTSGLPAITNGRYSLNLMLYSLGSCKVVAFGILLFELISAWIIVAFTVERTVIVWFPLRRVYITSRIRLATIVAICAVCLCASVHRLFLVKIVIDIGMLLCSYDPSGNMGAILWQLDTVLYNYLPCVLIFVSNILTLGGIFRSRRRIEGKHSKLAAKGDSKVILSLMLVSTFYVLFLMPPSIIWAYWSTLSESGHPDPIYVQFIFYLGYVFNLVSVLNYCCNFLVYGSTLPFYRKEIVMLFLGPLRRGVSKGGHGN